MARVKRGVTTLKKHKKILKLAKGYRGSKSRLIKSAKEAVYHASEYAFLGRKRKKREMRKLWITRLSQASKQLGLSYKDFIYKLKEKKIILDRKMLSEILISDYQIFKKIVEKAKD